MQFNRLSLVLGMSLVLSGVAENAYHARLRSALVKPHMQGFLTHFHTEADAVSLLEVHRETGSNSTDIPTINQIESTLADLEADKKAGKVTPGMENFVKTVKKMIDVEMMPAVMAQHKDAQGILNGFKKAFASCGTTRQLAKGGIATMKVTKTSSATSHKSCRAIEDKDYVSKEACQLIVDEKEKAKNVACLAFENLKKDPASEADNCHTSDVAEPYGLWLTRNRKDFQTKLAEYKKHEGLCKTAQSEFEKVQGPCNIKHNKYNNQKTLCNTKQLALETSTCTVAKTMKANCDSYNTCYDANKDTYLKQKPKIMVQEKDRKGEYRALKRIDCLLTEVFGNDEVDEKKIEECRNTTYTTKHLDLKYPAVPDKMACEKTPAVPGEKLFFDEQYKELPFNTKALEAEKCVLVPGGGIELAVPKTARKDKCQEENGWLEAQNGGSCLISGKDGEPIEIDYTAKKYTKYRFTMKMDETHPTNGITQGGGFSVCNLVGTSSDSNGASPNIAFEDGPASAWGYHLFGGFNAPVVKSKPATCKELLVSYKVWGRDGKGLELAKHTQGRMKWIGCMGDGCSANSFYCNDISDGIEFGSEGTLRGLLGSKVPTSHKGCATKANPDSVCNAMDKTKDIQALCENLGFTRGTILAKRATNYCPEVSFDNGKWGSDFVHSNGYGHKFRCQGAQSKKMYTNKKYYKESVPKAGEEKEWDLIMEYSGGKYKFASLSIQGIKFDGYKGSETTCPVANKNTAFTPRITASKNPGKVYLKDFRVFQGNDLKKPMKQIVGEGVGKHYELQQQLLIKKAMEVATKALKKAEVEEKDLGLKNDMTKVADWIDIEGDCNSKMPKKPFGSCDMTKSSRVGIWVKFKGDNSESFAMYDGVQNNWNRPNFRGMKATVATGFFTKCSGFHFLYANGRSLPMAWSRCSNKYSSNFDLDYNRDGRCSDWRSNRPGWKQAHFKLYCKTK